MAGTAGTQSVVEVEFSEKFVKEIALAECTQHFYESCLAFTFPIYSQMSLVGIALLTLDTAFPVKGQLDDFGWGDVWKSPYEGRMSLADGLIKIGRFVNSPFKAVSDTLRILTSLPSLLHIFVSSTRFTSLVCETITRMSDESSGVYEKARSAARFQEESTLEENVRSAQLQHRIDHLTRSRARLVQIIKQREDVS